MLVHLRHFGCILCRHFASRLAREHAKLDAAGIRVVAVGTGGRRYAAKFAADRGIEFPVLVDRDLQSHNVIGALSGPPWGILRPAVVRSAVEAFRDGQRQGKTGPHPWIFGAAHVFAEGGELRYAWLNENYNDNPPLEDLLAEAMRASGVGSHPPPG